MAKPYMMHSLLASISLFILGMLSTDAYAQVSFIGRTENHANTTNASVSIGPPAGVQDGDLLIMCVASWQTVPTAPNGFTPIGGSVANSGLEYMSVFYKFYSSSDALPYSVGIANYPDAVIRDYRGASALDAWNSAGSNGATTSLTIPSLPATKANGDLYVGCFANDTQPVNLPGDLGHTTTQASQWQLGDGDKALGNTGTLPPAETASSPNRGNWIGFAATFQPGTAPSPTPTPISAIGFIGRTENHANAANAPLAISPPAGVQNGDFMLLCVDSWQNQPTAPNGFTALGSVVNSVSEFMSIFYRFYSTADGLPYTLGASNFPDAVLRDYRGVKSVDVWGSAGSSGQSTFLTLPSLAPTNAGGDLYVACFAGSQAINLPSDLGHSTTQSSQWQLGDGDKLLGGAGTVPPAESATSASPGDWIGAAVTLQPGTPSSGSPTPTSTASATRTPTGTPSRTPTATPGSGPTGTPTVVLPTPTPTPGAGGAITFIGRTENRNDAASAPVTISPPAGIQSGDFMLLCVNAWESVPSIPPGFTFLGTGVNSGAEYVSSYYKFYSPADQLPYQISTTNYPDAVLRAYRGVGSFDDWVSAGSSNPTSLLTLPALPATSVSGEEYVACITNDSQAIRLPADLGHATSQSSLWFLGDGDKALGNAGTVPQAETASSSATGNWLGVAASLQPGTPPPAATPTPSLAPVYTGTPQGNDAGFTTPQVIPAATRIQGCYQVAFVVTDNQGTKYAGQPSGWTSVYSLGGGGLDTEILVHQNGPSEPSSNVWSTAGAKTFVFELNISGVCNTSGFDGGIAAYSGFNASSMNIAAPPTNSSGTNDLTLAFSNLPWDSIITMTGASDLHGFYTSVPSLGGYWYPGVPQPLIAYDIPTTLVYNGIGATIQASFAPLAH